MSNAGSSPNVEQLAAAIEVMEGQYERAAANETSASRARMAATSAIESVRQISTGDGQGQQQLASTKTPDAEQATTETTSAHTAGKPQDTIIGLGGGVFVPVTVPADTKVLVDIGSGVVLEKDAPYVLDYLENRVREIDIVIKNAGIEKANLAANINQYREQLRHSVQSTYGGQVQSGNV